MSPLAAVFLGRPCAEDGDYWSDLVDEVGWERAVRQIAVDRIELAVTVGHDMMYVVPNPIPAH